MPKIVGYPRASLTNAIDLANAVYELGGHSSTHTCADKMGKKTGGSFSALVSATDKFGLIASQRGELTTTDLFNEYKHAYSEEEGRKLLRKAFLSSDVFAALYERFCGQVVPAEILDRILIREFEVPAPAAARISGYFINGAKQTELLDQDNKLVDCDDVGMSDEDVVSDKKTPLQEDVLELSQGKVDENVSSMQLMDASSYSVVFRGPGLNTTIEITEEDDLLIVGAILKKIKTKIGVVEGEL